MNILVFVHVELQVFHRFVYLARRCDVGSHAGLAVDLYPLTDGSGVETYSSSTLATPAACSKCRATSQVNRVDTC